MVVECAVRVEKGHSFAFDDFSIAQEQLVPAPSPTQGEHFPTCCSESLTVCPCAAADAAGKPLASSDGKDAKQQQQPQQQERKASELKSSVSLAAGFSDEDFDQPPAGRLPKRPLSNGYWKEQLPEAGGALLNERYDSAPLPTCAEIASSLDLTMNRHSACCAGVEYDLYIYGGQVSNASSYANSGQFTVFAVSNSEYAYPCNLVLTTRDLQSKTKSWHTVPYDGIDKPQDVLGGSLVFASGRLWLFGGQTWINRTTEYELRIAHKSPPPLT